MKPIRITLPTPRLGGKCWVIQEPGLFVLEEGEGAFGTLACTHAGSGGVIIYDGVPDEFGNFPEFKGEENSPEWFVRPGREIYRAFPVVMGSWWINGGFYHGLTVSHRGESVHTTPMIGSLVWNAAKKAVK